MNDATDRCPSLFRLDRLLAGELGKEPGEPTGAHVESCPVCRERIAARVAERAEFRASMPPLSEILNARSTAPLPPRRRASWWPAASLVTVAAAAVCAAVVWPKPAEPPGELRTKGSERLGAYVQRDAAVAMLASGDIVRPGDPVRLTYTTGAPSHLVVVGRDSVGTTTVYYPDGPRAARVEPGDDVPLPGSLVFDDIGELETLFFAFCDAAIEVELVVGAVNRADQPTPAGCRVGRFVLLKRAEP